MSKHQAKHAPPTGELRQSQLLTTFGPGSMVDLPNHAVLITNDRAGQLWFDEGGAGNDFTEIYVRDERNDNRRRPLSDATVPGARILGTCQGRKPWLGPRIRDACEEPNRLLTRSASNAYFSQTLSVIHIPMPRPH